MASPTRRPGRRTGRLPGMTETPPLADQTIPEQERWLTPGVRGIGTASFLADVGHEIPTALLPSLLTSTLGAPAAALGAIEGVSDALAGAARFGGGVLADDPARRPKVAVGGYATTAVLGAATAGATAVWQVGVLRAAAWTARGLRVPARNALLADIVPAKAYGRAYGFERMMDNLGAIFGPLLALGLVAWLGVTWAIGLSVIPGLLAAVAIIYAIRHTPKPTSRDKVPLKIRIRPVLQGDIGQLMAAVAAFEVGNVAATLLILRASDLLAPEHGTKTATTIALGLYTAYNVAATLASVPAGRLSDRLGSRGPVLVLTGGVAAFAAAYGLFTINGAAIAFLAIPFLLAGIGIGAVETAQHSAVAALAPTDLRGSAFGMLATVQSLGNLAASTIAGILWTAISPTAAFTYLTAWMLLALIGLGLSFRR
ncbi:MFS family permease [Streptomyces sp. V1I1]|nr:MFS family permease [Streptomyces sp. V1I1]